MTSAGVRPKLLPVRSLRRQPCGRAHPSCCRPWPCCRPPFGRRLPGPTPLARSSWRPTPSGTERRTPRGAAGSWWCGDSGSRRLARKRARRAPAGAERIALAGTTLIPGLIEGHSHLFLHPYDETLWDDQVLKEPLGLRIARAVAHAAATLRAGITTERDLGTEGALDNDVQLRRAIEQGIVPGPRLLAVTRAIVATGSYGPARSRYAFDPPQGAEEADGEEAIVAGGARADRPRGRLDQGLRRLRLGPRRRAPADVHAARARGARRDGARGRPAGRGARDDAGGDAPRGAGRRRDHRARRRGHARGVPAHAQARRRALSDAGRGRGVRHLLRRVGQGPRRAERRAGRQARQLPGRARRRA